jgi:hypothetical protein
MVRCRGHAPACYYRRVEDITWTLVFLLFFGGPLLGLLSVLGYLRARGSAERRERDTARQTYEKVMLEKLDVVKTAIVMGYSHNELAELDRRLATLIGEDRLKGLTVEKGKPTVPQVGSAEIEREIYAVAELARQHRQQN